MNLKMCFTRIKKEEVKKYSESELLWQSIYSSLLDKDNLKESNYTFRVIKLTQEENNGDENSIICYMSDYKSANVGIAQKAVIADSITFLGSYLQNELEMTMSYKKETSVDLLFNEYQRELTKIDSSSYLFLDVSELKESIYYYITANFYERIHTRLRALGIYTIFIFKGDKAEGECVLETYYTEGLEDGYGNTVIIDLDEKDDMPKVKQNYKNSKKSHRGKVPKYKKYIVYPILVTVLAVVMMYVSLLGIDLANNLIEPNYKTSVDLETTDAYFKTDFEVSDYNIVNKKVDRSKEVSLVEIKFTRVSNKEIIEVTFSQIQASMFLAQYPLFSKVSVLTTTDSFGNNTYYFDIKEILEIQ